ncbi:DUF2637 domain-containing protein [Micromonospora sp. DT62]|uniref:DUF2637 domain-containing protein n=1 Tax=Micromonospora sp. DT62 TaxID=3416521 RepID=UPI003CE945F7
MNRSTITSRAAAALVAAVAGFASYQHIYDVASKAGEHVTVSAVLPLAIDGLILVATLAMLDDKRQHRRPRLSARVALVFGILATLAANVASANPNVTARLVAAVPAVSFLLAVEVLSRSGRPLPVDELPPAEAADEPAPVLAPVYVYAAPIGPEPAPVAPEPVVEPVRRPRVTARSLTAAQRVEAAHERHPDATHERIAQLARCSVATVKRHRPKPAVTGSPSAPDAAETPSSDRVNGTLLHLAGGLR